MTHVKADLDEQERTYEVRGADHGGNYNTSVEYEAARNDRIFRELEVPKSVDRNQDTSDDDHSNHGSYGKN